MPSDRNPRTRSIALAVALVALCATLAVPATALAAYRQTYLIRNSYLCASAFDVAPQPFGLAFDSGDNLWIADNGGFAARFTYSGDYDTLVGAGDPNVFGIGVRLQAVRGVAIYETRAWLCDYDHGVAPYNTTGGSAGMPIFSAATPLDLPESVAVDSVGNVFVGDRGGEGTYGFRISKFDANGTYLNIHFGDTEGYGKYLTAVNGIAVDARNGDVYVADGSYVRRYRPTNVLQTAYALNATWEKNEFESPIGVACDPVDGSVFVSDGSSMTVTKLSSSGLVLAHWSGGLTGGVFDDPRGIALAFNRHVFVADNDGAHIREFELQDIGPTTKAYGTVTVKKNHTAKFKYEGNDDVSNTLSMTIRIYKGSKLKKTIKLGSVSQGVWHTKSLKITLPRGSYTWKVYATDAAHHAQRNIAYKTLKVK